MLRYKDSTLRRIGKNSIQNNLELALQGSSLFEGITQNTQSRSLNPSLLHQTGSYSVEQM